jgi:hypothetical protein
MDIPDYKFRRVFASNWFDSGPDPEEKGSNRIDICPRFPDKCIAGRPWSG